MFGFLKSIFGGKSSPHGRADAASVEDSEKWYDHKSALMEEVLGKEHTHVMHAIIPFAIGGGLDLYYYPNGIPGTGVATKELSEEAGAGPSNRELTCYELVMFTRLPLDLDAAKDEDTPFGQVHRRINAILNPIARYAGMAELNPYETCEFPPDMETVGGACLVFAEYGRRSDEVVQDFGLLAVIEVFREEMEFARENGGENLIQLLKEAGAFPYTDLDRVPVV
jgi:hypothetical protein